MLLIGISLYVGRIVRKYRYVEGRAVAHSLS
jgi:hypothetical protein